MNKKNYTVLSKNIQFLNIKDKSRVFFKDAFDWVKKQDLSEFDLIFIDPPFDQELELKILRLLIRKNELKSSCKIYLEYSKFTEIEIPESLTVLKEKSVGDVKALLLQKI